MLVHKCMMGYELLLVEDFMALSFCAPVRMTVTLVLVVAIETSTHCHVVKCLVW